MSREGSSCRSRGLLPARWDGKRGFGSRETERAPCPVYKESIALYMRVLSLSLCSIAYIKKNEQR